MSIEVLNIELEQRRQELIHEQEENDRARRIRAEVLQEQLRRPPLNMLQVAAYDEAAREIRRWWKSCQWHARTKTTNAQIAALCRRIRGLGRARSNR